MSNPILRHPHENKRNHASDLYGSYTIRSVRSWRSGSSDWLQYLMQASNIVKLLITNVSELDRRAIIGNPMFYKMDLSGSNILPLLTYQVVIISLRTIVMATAIQNGQLLKFCAS